MAAPVGPVVGDAEKACNRRLSAADVLAMLRPHWPAAEVHDVQLYQRAMTPRSATAAAAAAAAAIPQPQPQPQATTRLREAAASHRDCTSSERLEFLGDAVLGLAVAAYLHERYPREQEGFLSGMRAKVVNGAALAALATAPSLSLDRWVVLTRAQEDAQARRSAAVLEDAFEAFLGALFLDAGFGAAHAWLVAFLEANVDFPALVAGQDGARAQLTRHMHAAFKSAPRFSDLSVSVASNGAKHYTVGVRSGDGGAIVGTGVGTTRRAAEDAAAIRALLYYGQGGAAPLTPLLERPGRSRYSR
jgi:ribonuclease-3